MGNAFSEPYEQVEHQSGASRLLNSIVMAVCVAPLLILGMCVMLGWNEQRAVCSQKAIQAGRDGVTLVGCGNPMAGSGSLVEFSCDIVTDSLPLMSFNQANNDFSVFKSPAVGMKIESVMYQCVEEKHSRTEKTQGGGKNTITTYTYRLDWKSDRVDSGRFGSHSNQARDAFRSGCGERQNPAWPTNAPKGETKYQETMKVGVFTTTLTDKVPIETFADMQAPGQWKTTGTGNFYLGQQPSSPQLGDMKVSLKINDPTNLKTTVLGQNNAGTIGKWVAPSSWLCSDFTLADLRMGTVSKDVLFKMLASEENAKTWILRLVGFVVMWVAFCLCFGPLEVAGDCIPCVGPYIGDSIAAISCCVACLPATACTLGVAGVVWIVMRPLIGIPCMIAFVLIVGGFGSYIAKQRASKRGGPIATGGPPNPTYGAVQVQAPGQAVAVAQPMAPQPRQMQAQAPMGSFPGQMVQILTPEGMAMQVQVPAGVAPGGLFTVNY